MKLLKGLAFVLMLAMTMVYAGDSDDEETGNGRRRAANSTDLPSDQGFCNRPGCLCSTAEGRERILLTSLFLEQLIRNQPSGIFAGPNTMPGAPGVVGITRIVLVAVPRSANPNGTNAGASPARDPFTPPQGPEE